MVEIGRPYVYDAVQCDITYFVLCEMLIAVVLPPKDILLVIRCGDYVPVAITVNVRAVDINCTRPITDDGVFDKHQF